MIKVSFVRCIVSSSYFWIYSFCSLCYLFYAAYIVLFHTPDDYLQGAYFKILYIHVPSAWLSIGLYLLMAMCAAFYLVIKNPVTHILSLEICRLGMLHSVITLVTGAMWGKVTWGAWWVWDARLTSMLILLILYYSHYLIAHSFKNPERAAKNAAIIALIGTVNIPIIKFSVYLWSTLHQKSTFFRSGGPSMHYTMLKPLLISFSANLFWCFSMLLIGIHNAIVARSRRRNVKY